MGDEQVGMKKIPYSIYIDRDLLCSLEAFAERHDKPKSLVVEAALTSFLRPEDSDRREAAITRRLDRIARLLERLDRNDKFTFEAIALFVRHWLTSYPGLAERSNAEARIKGAERYALFIEALGQRVRISGSTTLDELDLHMRPPSQPGESDPTAR